MSSLEKMTIQGIRSYGPRTCDTQIIEFFTPVTLIIGQNGSGKTTIIECLKYATTSVMPPDAKGSSFLFDPKLIDEVETRGQIKLYFKDMSGLNVQVQKNMANTQKAKKLEFRTIETIISRYDASNKLVSTITSKCINADAEVVNAFGVSKAVLDHVIFCHQEDSNWPLCEGKLLKTRFDEIFDATKYIKALELLKKIRLEKSQQIKQMEVERRHLENYKNRSEQLESDLEDYKSKYAALETKKQATMEKLRPIEKQIDVFMKESMRLLQAKTKMDAIEYEKASLERQIKELLAATKDCLFNGSDAELKEYAETFVATSVQTRRDEEENLTLNIEELSEKLRQLGHRKSKLTVEIGMMEKERKTYEEKKAKLVELAKKASAMIDYDLKAAAQSQASSKAGANKYDGGGGQFAELQAKFKEFIQDYESESKKIQDALDMEMLEVQNQVDQQREQKSKIDLTIANKQATIEKNERQIGQIQSELQAVANDKVLDDLDKKIQAGQAKLTAESGQLGDVNEMKADVTKIEANIEELQQTEHVLDKKLNKLHENAKFQTEINMLKSDKKCKEDQIRKIRMRINEDLDSFFGLDEDSDEKFDLGRRIKNDLALKALFEAEQKRLLEELAKTQEAHKEIERRVYSSELNRKNLFNEQRQKETQFRECEDKLLQHSDCISDQSDIERFDEILEKLKEQQKSTTDEKGFLSGVDKTYKRFIAQMQDKNSVGGGKPMTDGTNSARSCHTDVDGMSCPVCMRCFKDTQEVDDTVRELRRYINKLPQKVTDIEAKQKTLESKIERMINLKSVKETHDRLKSVELPRIQAQLQAFDRETLPKLKKEMEQCSAKLKKLEAHKATSEHLRDEIILVDKCAADCRDLEKKIQTNTAIFSCHDDDDDGGAGQGQGQVTISGDDTIERIKEQKKITQDEIKRLCKMIECKRNEMTQVYERVDKINSAKDELAKLKERRQELSAKMSKKTQLVEKMHELQKEADECTDTIKSLDSRLKSVLKAIAALNDQKDEKQREIREKMSDRVTQCGELKALSANLLSCAQYVHNYENAELPRLVALRTELKTFEAEEQRYQEEVDSSRVKLDEIKTDLVRFEIKQREIKDNLRLREKRAEYVEKMELYKRQREELSLGENVDLNNLNLEKKKAEAERDKLHKELNDIKNSINQMEGRLQAIKEELALEQHQNATEKFMAASCDYRVLEVAVKDIEKYSKALDRAIMNYHLMKMNEINKIIKQLWRQVYRGTDIDYLEIRSEESADEAAETSKTRRTYNYRVVLVKEGMALDMRGRCSAGQKVLASIIIRLALAETFCLNSGILTLDEPTTNLDRENIESLASALVEIIKTRSTQKNFQLIIITHDEDFVEMLGRSEYMDQFYRVSKDDKGFSRISRRTHLNL